MAPRMSDDELIAAHRLAQERRGLTPSTVNKCEGCLRVFSRSLGRKSMLTVKEEDIDKFLDGRRNRDGTGAATMATRAAWLAHLHGFYSRLLKDGRITADPTAKIDRPRVSKGLPRPANTAKLLKALDLAGPELRCWVLLAAFQGLRCQEIAGIQREDVMDEQGLLLVAKGKGGKQRTLSLHPQTLEALVALPLPKRGYLFTRPMGGPYPPHDLSRKFNLFLDSAGVGATAHQLRHWFGSNLYAESRDIRMTQEQMGHSSPDTTAVYVAFDQKAAAPFIRALSFEPKETP